MTIPGQKSRTDWDRVKREYDSEAPIPYDPNDPDDGPFDPNDDEAVARFLSEADRISPQVPIKKKTIPKVS